jgi:hypothetical protein
MLGHPCPLDASYGKAEHATDFQNSVEGSDDVHLPGDRIRQSGFDFAGGHRAYPAFCACQLSFNRVLLLGNEKERQRGSRSGS